ncbi:molybdenum cofactor synthesis domain-containing protein [Hydrogenispora ethanolica]|uniref:Molybdopterin molybdenumtransferase n=1 Tax=Hydrogenispora ethanolica TaxID=1082276 RepID=A0A4R1S1V4_HYDET|nr:molybdopterin-binding protein [Hydrogenispora ethanolica]TCL73143.1 molybdenum cofactor synthesis domain-containing protein [Hydrogenispora ethanolica]
MQKVKVEEAVGMVLAHDLTKIVPGEFKGAAFKKGHIIRAEDIEELKNIGKNHLWVVPLGDGRVHENEAAGRLAAAAAAQGLSITKPREGKANIVAVHRGLLKINRSALAELNQIPDIAVVTLYDNTIVEPEQIVAAAKIIPLTMDREELERAERICGRAGPVIATRELFRLKVGIVVTGSEVYSGRIQDRFGAVLKAKIAHYGGEFLDLQYAPDDTDFIQGRIQGMLERGAELVLISGGMAVDADDVTPQAIARSASEVVAYGVPLLPGAMCMVAYHGATPLVGVPACAMYNQTTILDVIMPRLLAKERLTRADLAALAHGGLCRQCEVCHYPVCSFGKS